MKQYPKIYTLIKNLFYLFKYINFKTLRFNLNYFPFHIAKRFPVFISKNVILKSLKGEIFLDNSEHIYPGKIKIGFCKVGVFDESTNKTIWEVNGKVVFKGSAYIGQGSAISVGFNGNLILGKEFIITAASKIIANNFILFGDQCLLSWEIIVIDDDFHIIYDEKNIVLNKSKPIIIGNKNWIGSRTTILKGTQIGNNNVVSAFSLLNKEISGDNQIIGGIPATILKSNIYWKI